jgi:hypothetical protein
MRKLGALGLILLLVAACSGAATTEPGGDAGSEAPAPGFPFQDGERRGSALDIGFETEVGRRVIRSASLHLHASDTREAYDRIVAAVESKGGYVASASVNPSHRDDAQPVVALTVRVPAERLTETMLTVRGMVDDVVSETQTAHDVTDQFVDLQARLTNLRALETELRAMLEEVRQHPDADPDKVLRVFNELASVRGQIEELQGRINYLSNLTEMATLEMSITQTPAAVPIVSTPWAPAEAAREAARNLVSALQAMANWLIGFAIFTLPVLLLVLTPPAAVGYWAYRKWGRGRKRPPQAAEGATT